MLLLIIITKRSGRSRSAYKFLSVGHIREQGYLSCSLYSFGQLALMHSAGAGGPAGQNLAALGEEAAKLACILIVDML